jgi:hypothetical protein
VQVYSHERSQRPLHPIQSVGRNGWKPHNKLGNCADSDDNFIPATSTAHQATTISHDSPINFIVQPYNHDAGASYACRSVLEEVTEGGWCASKLGLGPEYPGLQDESELERMSHLACSASGRLV